MKETIDFLNARIEALERELVKKTNLLKEAQNLLAELAKDMEVDYEQIN